MLSSATYLGARATVVLDGALENRTALALELRAHGLTSGAECDGQVIEAAWLCWGVDMLPRLQGAFTLALLDSLSGRVILARDRFGQRPLLVARTPKTICFASELSALMAWPGLRREPDPDVLASIVAFGHAPVAASPMLGVRRVPPGHVWSIHPDGRLDEVCWWSMQRGSGTGPVPSGPDIAAQIAAAVRTQADAAGAIIVHQGDETALLEACLTEPATAPTTPLLPRPDLVMSLVERQGEPIAPDALVPALTAGAAGAVLLSPIGAGELFLSHRRYRVFARTLAALRDAQRRGAIPRDGGFHEAPLSPRELWHTASGGMSEADRLNIAGPALLHTTVWAAPAAYGAILCEATPDRVMAEAARLDLSLRIPARDLAALDVAATTTGARIVCPFLESDLVEALARAPDNARRWLIQAPATTEPDLSAWHPMAASLRSFTEDTLLGAACRGRELFSRGRMEALLRRQDPRPQLDAAGLWAILGIELWCQCFLDGATRVERRPDYQSDEQLLTAAREAA